MIPPQYTWLKSERSPQILLEFLNIHGTIEHAGTADNPTILSWAKECGVDKIYHHDSEPWCALAMTLCAKRAGLPHPTGYAALRAKSFATWGIPQKTAMLGDVLVFERPGGAHTGLYVGEDDQCFHVLGGNQSNSVNITRIEKSRTIAIRRSEGGQSENIKSVHVSLNGEISTNEA